MATTGGMATLADLVWRWRREEPGLWRAIEASAPNFLGHRVATGTLDDALSSWLAPGARERLRALLERARGGQPQRTELRVHDTSGLVYRVRVAALTGTVTRSDEVVLAFVTLGLATSSESFDASRPQVSQQRAETDYQKTIGSLLSLLRQRLACEEVELQLHGILGGELKPLAATHEGEAVSAQVAEPVPRRGVQWVELPITFREQLLGTLRVRGADIALVPRDEHWQEAADVFHALRISLIGWFAAHYTELWAKMIGLLRLAQREMDNPRVDSLRQLCRAVAEALGADRAHLWCIDLRSGSYRVQAYWGFDEEERTTLRVLELPAWVTEVLADSAAGAQSKIIEPPNEPNHPRATRQILLRLDQGGLLLVDWIAGHPKLSEGLADMVLAVASVWFRGARLAAEADQAIRHKADFVATMSHELRTPLNTLMGYTDLLACEEFGPLTDEQRDVLARMDRSARELLELINATLEFSRMQSHAAALQVEWVSLPVLLSELDRELAYARQRRGLSWAVRVDPDAAELQTDREKLKVVLKNLLTNAVKFTERGGVTVTARRMDGDVEIAVQDTGIGIDPTLLPVIFQPFRQGEPASTRRFGGVGLGLYLVQRLVEFLGGTVTVESEPQKGSVFRIRIPGALPSGR